MYRYLCVALLLAGCAPERKAPDTPSPSPTPTSGPVIGPAPGAAPPPPAAS